MNHNQLMLFLGAHVQAAEDFKLLFATLPWYYRMFRPVLELVFFSGFFAGATFGRRSCAQEKDDASEAKHDFNNSEF